MKRDFIISEYQTVVQRFLVKQKESLAEAVKCNLRWGGPDIEQLG